MSKGTHSLVGETAVPAPVLCDDLWYRCHLPSQGHEGAGGFADEEMAQLDPEGWVNPGQIEVGEHSKERTRNSLPQGQRPWGIGTL